MAEESKIAVVVLPSDRPCEVRFLEPSGRYKRVIVMPPHTETGYHTSDERYTLAAITRLDLDRQDQDGNPIEGEPKVELDPGGEIVREVGEADHNVLNNTEEYVVFTK